MGPNAWHRGDDPGAAGDLTDVVSVVVAGYRRR
jgi:hypothetical protein